MNAASFTSPIVSILEYTNIYYHACGSALTGKAALLRFAMSIWGDPGQITFQY
ncbi:MAG: DUF927 domain-containing protein [Synergistaceae bacterium]|nr:DUF927 domain-containing protein [Synergistaceae bacterium]